MQYPEIRICHKKVASDDQDKKHWMILPMIFRSFRCQDNVGPPKRVTVENSNRDPPRILSRIMLLSRPFDSESIIRMQYSWSSLLYSIDKPVPQSAKRQQARLLTESWTLITVSQFCSYWQVDCKRRVMPVHATRHSLSLIGSKGPLRSIC